MSELEALDDRVRELANLRKQLELAKEVEAGYEVNYQETLQYKIFLKAQEQRKRVEDQVKSAETWVRATSLAIHKETGEKKFPGVTIKLFKTIKYDIPLAVEWCKERLPEALTIIPKTFEKVAEIMQPDFVKFDEDPRATIASDLSQFMEGE